LSFRIKHVLLKDFNLSDTAQFQPDKDIEIKWQQDADLKKNNETHASFIGNNKTEINNQLSKLSNHILSERVRTLNEIPKYRIINTVKRRIW
jgi:hypothetical protein